MTAGVLYEALGCPEAEDIAIEMGVDRTLLGKKTSELSGGERKKAYLAAAFALDPALLLLDEPTNSLDAAGRSVLARLLKQRKEKGRGALIITHDAALDEAADRVVAIRTGVITDEG